MEYHAQADQDGRKGACQDVHRSASIRLADPASLQLGKGRVWHPESRVHRSGVLCSSSLALSLALGLTVILVFCLGKSTNFTTINNVTWEGKTPKPMLTRRQDSITGELMIRANVLEAM